MGPTPLQQPPAAAVTATYAASPAFLTSPDWANVRHALQSTHLPLRNLEWKPASRPAVRTVSHVPVDLVPLDLGSLAARPSTDGGAGGLALGSRPPSVRLSSSGTPAPEGRSPVPKSLLDKPVVNLYFVVCDDTETYKLTTRAQLKAWHALAASRPGQEWLVVHVVRSDPSTGLPRSSSGTGWGRNFGGGSVLDRMRADFNVGKRDRCVQLARPTYPAPDSADNWADLLDKFKAGVLSAFDARVAQREDECKTLEGMRTVQGWNFCSFFLLKESLAHSFEGMGLVEDALVQYNELEASFFQVLKEGNQTFLPPSLPPTLTTEDSLSILNQAAKNYHDLLVTNTISTFDVRVYLFARQGRLLGRLGRKGEVLRRAVEFVRSLGAWLDERAAALPPCFVQSWVFCACANAVETCRTFKQVAVDELAADRAARASEGELWAMARVQLDKLGLRAGHLPSAYPFNALSPPSSLSSDPVPPTITRRDLLAAYESREAFDVLFYDVTDKAVDGFKAAGRERCSLALIGSLGTVDFHRERYDSAFARFASLAARFSSYGWTALEAFYLAKTLRTHDLLAGTRDSEWVARVLALLRCLARGGKEGSAMWEGEEGGLAAFVKGLVEGMREAGRALDKETAVHGHPAFVLKLQSKCATRPSPADGDGCLLKMKVTSHLPCAVLVDDVRACLSGKDIEQLWFTSGQVTLQPGENEVEILCPMPVSGLWTVESTQLRFASIALHYLYIPSRVTDADARMLVRLPADPYAVDAEVVTPLALRLDAQPTVELRFRTGRNSVRKAVAALRVVDDELLLGLRDAKLVSGEIASLSTAQDAITLEDVAPDSLVVLSIPYRGTPRGSAVTMRISVDYWTEKRPAVKRALRKADALVLALPLSVNVQDIFRESCLVSRFTVSSDGKHHIRLAGATLSGAEDTLEITPCRSEDSPIINVSPNCPASCLFRMTEKDKSHQQHETLRLTIKYRTLAEELRHLLDVLLEPILLPSDLLPHRAWFASTLLNQIVKDPRWASMFFGRGIVDVPDVEVDELRRASASLGLDESGFRKVVEAWETAVEALDDFVAPPQGPLDLHWRTLQIPVDVPLRQVLSAVELSIATPDQVSVGQPLSCIMAVSCSSRWAGADAADLPGGKLDGVWMSYELVADVGDWLVSGRRKGTFVVQEGKQHKTTLTLIGLRAGTLSLPHVAVAPLGAHAHLSAESYLVNAAEQVEVLPVGGRATFVVGAIGSTSLPPPLGAGGGPRPNGAGERRLQEV